MCHPSMPTCSGQPRSTKHNKHNFGGEPPSCWITPRIRYIQYYRQGNTQPIGHCRPYPKSTSVVINPTIGLIKNTCIALITHLHDTYCCITEVELDANFHHMHSQWNPPNAIELPLQQIEHRVAFTTAGDDPPSLQHNGRTHIIHHHHHSMLRRNTT
jgi:hypothetical protein